MRSRYGATGPDPYGWIAAKVLAAMSEQARVLDLACGSAPLSARLAAHRYVGVDASAGEVRAARRAGAWPLLRADAAAIPLADGSVEAVVCSMALMVVTPLTPVLQEISRVLAPGGLLVATLPSSGPLRRQDVVVVAGLVSALGRRLSYPNDTPLHDLEALLRQAGLRIESDERRRFGYRLRDRNDADLLLRSLYLPGVRPWRRRMAGGYLRWSARLGIEVPVPIRLVVARRAS